MKKIWTPWVVVNGRGDLMARSAPGVYEPHFFNDTETAQEYADWVSRVDNEQAVVRLVRVTIEG